MPVCGLPWRPGKEQFLNPVRRACSTREPFPASQRLTFRRGARSRVLGGTGEAYVPCQEGTSMNRITLAVALTVATVSTGALAQSNEEQQACMNDAFRVCSATIPDRNRTIACMVQNKSQLSAACQVVMDKYAPGGDVSQMTAYASPTPAPVTSARTTMRNASMKPVKTAIAQRPGKPLNILMR
jgi:hypothetical protein